MEALLEGGEGESEVSVSRATYLRNRLTPEEAEQFATQVIRHLRPAVLSSAAIFDRHLGDGGADRTC